MFWFEKKSLKPVNHTSYKTELLCLSFKDEDWLVCFANKKKIGREGIDKIGKDKKKKKKIPFGRDIKNERRKFVFIKNECT